jgi:hypothetical protein
MPKRFSCLHRGASFHQSRCRHVPDPLAATDLPGFGHDVSRVMHWQQAACPSLACAAGRGGSKFEVHLSMFTPSISPFQHFGAAPALSLKPLAAPKPREGGSAPPRLHISHLLSFGLASAAQFSREIIKSEDRRRQVLPLPLSVAMVAN